MELLEELETLGVNVQEGLDRVIGDKDLYVMMLDMFVDAVKQQPIDLVDFDAADYDALIKHVHTLKGTTGNPSMTPLFQKYNEILGLLRDGNPAPAKAIMAKLLPVQEKIVDCIVKHK